METTRYKDINKQNNLPSSIVIMIIACCCIQGTYMDCPNLCECKWKSGKESVLCLNANLSTIPLHLDAGTQVLDLTGNNIMTVKHDEFSTAGLINLQKIYIAKCRLKVLERYAFRHLINVIELDLSYNVLSAVPSHAFDSIPELRELRLSGNPIQRVLNDAFVHVPHLVRLELSSCKIGNVEARAFAGLENTLEWLYLDNNRITDIRSTTITSLRNLHGIELANNPWNCSCTLRPLREWMLRYNVPYGIPPVCRSPARLAGKLWDRLELDEFACAPAIEAQIPKAYGVEGRNVTMSCRIGGVPEPNVRWLLKNRVIANLSGVPYNGNGKKLYIVHLQDQASNLTILTADTQDAGTYVCTAENKAGRAEATVTLAVSRRLPENSLTSRALVVTVIVSIVFLLSACLLVVCACGVRKRQQARGLANDQRREENYEKIEMNNKISNCVSGANNGVIPKTIAGPNVCTTSAGGGAVGAGSGIILSVGAKRGKTGRRRGDYRGVPTVDTDLDDEEDAGYEDDVENTPTPSTANRDTIKHWSSYEEARIGSPLNVSHWASEGNAIEADLHIPRRSPFGENNLYNNRDDRTKPERSISGTFNEIRANNEQIHSKPRIEAPTTQHKLKPSSNRNLPEIPVIPSPVLHPHVMRKQVLEKSGGTLYTSASPSTMDRNFPDLLEPTSSVSPTKESLISGSHYLGRKQMEQLNCTLPRKRGIYGRASSKCHNSTDSEAPLLADSRYSSSGGEDNSEHCLPLNRRSSVESANPAYRSNINDTQRANSYLNLQSLPTSPLDSIGYTSAETPLLNISNLEARNNSYLARTQSPESSTNANTYDYHAAQLERFLEEYRSLQAQLNKMKETCEGIRQTESKKNENPIKSTTTTASTIFMDPLLYNSNIVISPSNEITTPMDLHPQSLLKGKSSATAGILSPLTGNTIPDAAAPLMLSPGDYGNETISGTVAGTTSGGVTESATSAYWLPRNTLLKRFNGNAGGNNYNFQS